MPAGVPEPEVSPFSCYVVGDGVLAVRCAEHLLESGHQVLGIHATEPLLREWALKNGIALLRARSSFSDALLRGEHDFLFCVNTSWIISQELIQSARRTSINFHDAPLPKYAGLFATSWALLKGEKHHGVTWHEVTPRVDAGRIYRQVDFDIRAEDTALTLNARAMEAGEEAFRELLPSLARGTAEPSPQAMRSRTYFGRGARPPAMCVISLAEPAAKLKNLVRALDFGRSANPFGAPKLWLGGGFAVVDELCVGAQTVRPRGTVLDVGDGSLCVAGGERVLTFPGLRSLTGAPLTRTTLNAWGVTEGMRLPELSPDTRGGLSAYNQAVCRYEARWVARLGAPRPFVHPYVERHPGVAAALTRVELRAMQAGAAAADNAQVQDLPSEQLASLAAYCLRMSDEDGLDVGLAVRDLPHGVEDLFEAVVPLRASLLGPKELFSQFAQRVAAELRNARKFGSVATDARLRYPELSQHPPRRFGVGVTILSSPSDLNATALRRLNADWVVAWYRDGSPPELASLGALDPGQARVVAAQLSELWQTATDRPKTPVVDLPISAGVRPLLDGDDYGGSPPPPMFTATALFSAQAARSPDAPAVSCGERSLSYAELETAANHVAWALSNQGVGRGDVVFVCVPRHVDVVVALLGILKSGAAYVPMDPSCPRRRVDELMAVSDASYVLTHEALREPLFSGCPRVMCLDTVERDACPGLPPETPIGGGDCMYVIHTSGSTGRPKGVSVTHEALVHHSWAIGHNYNLCLGERILQSASIGFDLAAEEIFPALFRGAEVVIRPEDLFESFARLRGFIEERSITQMILPTAAWHAWVSHMEEAGERAPTSLRLLCTGTEKVMTASLRTWERLSEGRVQFFQGYGPTETTITCAMYAHAHGTSFGDLREVPIGGPLPGTRLYVLDRFLNRVPVGVPGELYVAGKGVALGYHGEPGHTAARFVPDPFGTSGARMYRTGDVVRWLSAGQLVFMGRTDAQVKIRGFRVEPGEIESALRGHPKVSQVVVTAGANGTAPGDARKLAAYVIGEEGAEPSPGELKRFLQQRLPLYMVPDHFVTLEAFPLTANQKIDRAALPLPGAGAHAPSQLGTPRTPTEQLMMDVWAEVLGIPRPASSAHFFELGGDSLQAIRVIDKAQQRGFRIRPSDLFQHPVLADLARVAARSPRTASGGSDESTLIVLRKHGRGERIFFLHSVPGDLIGYAHLVNALPDHPCLGFQALGLTRPEKAHVAISEMAHHYVRELIRFQPKGPYHLVGWCFGGRVAFEMARILRRQGREVGLLGLVGLSPDRTRVASLTYRARLLLDRGNDYGLRTLCRRALANRPSKAHAAANFSLDINDGVFANRALVAEHNMAAMRGYRTSYYAGPITVFRASREPDSFESFAEDSGWSRFAAELDVHTLDAHHAQMLTKEHAATIAAVLKSAMASAPKRARGLVPRADTEVRVSL